MAEIKLNIQSDVTNVFTFEIKDKIIPTQIVFDRLFAVWHGREEFDSIFGSCSFEMRVIDGVTFKVWKPAEFKLGDCVFKGLEVFDMFDSNARVLMQLPHSMFIDGKQLWDYTAGEAIFTLRFSEYIYNGGIFTSNTDVVNEQKTYDSLSDAERRIYNAAPELWKRSMSVERVLDKMSVQYKSIGNLWK